MIEYSNIYRILLEYDIQIRFTITVSFKNN